MRKYKIGESNIRGRFVSVSENLQDIDKETFFNEIEKAIVFYKLERYRKKANLIKNLKIGVTIGDIFFKIK